MERSSPAAAARPFPLWPYLLVNAVAAVWLDLTRFHDLQSSDSLVFVMSSLFELRPFFWEQDRVGMLVPLLAAWCRSPFHNLLVQGGVMIFAGLTAPVLLARVLTTARAAPLAVTAANALFVGLAPEVMHETWFLVCNYPSALALALGGVTLLDGTGPRWRGWLRTAASGLLVTLGLWQYLGAIVFLVPLVVFRAWLAGGPGLARGWGWLVRPLTDPTHRTALVLLVVGFGVVQVGMRGVRASNAAIAPTYPDATAASEWVNNVRKLVDATVTLPGMDGYLAVMGWSCGVGLVVGAVAFRAAVGRTAWAVAPALLAATAEVGFLATREWVTMNGHHHRYLVAAITVTVVAAAVVGLAPALARLPRRFEWVAIVAAGLALVLATTRYGPPSAAAVHARFDDKWGELTPTVLTSDCDAIGADYMTVWPTVFHANMTLYERGSERVVFGVGYRSEPMIRRWAPASEEFTIVVPDRDREEVEGRAARRGLAAPFVRAADPDRGRPPTAREATFHVYRTRVVDPHPVCNSYLW